MRVIESTLGALALLALAGCGAAAGSQQADLAATQAPDVSTNDPVPSSAADARGAATDAGAPDIEASSPISRLPAGLSEDLIAAIDASGFAFDGNYSTCETQVSDFELLTNFCADPNNQDAQFMPSGRLVCPPLAPGVGDCNWRTAESPATEPIWSFAEGFVEGELTRAPLQQVSGGDPLRAAPFAAFFYSDLYDGGLMPRYSTEIYFMSELRNAPGGERIGWLKLQGHSGDWPDIDGATLMFWFPGETAVPQLEVKRTFDNGWDPIPVFDRSADEEWLRVTSLDLPPVWVSANALDCCGTFKLRLTANSAR